MRDLRFSRRWRFMSWSSELWHRDAMWCDRMLHPRDAVSMVLRNVGILPHQYTESQPRRPTHKIIRTAKV